MSPEEKIICQLFDSLDKKRLLDIKNRNSLSPEFKKILDRIKEAGGVFFRFKKIVDDNMLWNDFIQNIKQSGLSENDIKVIFHNFLTQYSLDFIEVMKKFFIENLKQGAVIDKKTINSTMTLGTLVVSLGKECNIPDLIQLIPYEFRNVLGHGTYWWDKDDFCYYDDGTIKRLTVKEFMDEMNVFDNTYLLFFRKYISIVPP